MKQLLKNKYNVIGVVFLITTIIRIAYSFAAGALMNKWELSDGMMTTVGQVLYILPALFFWLVAKERRSEIVHFRTLRFPSVCLLVLIGLLMIPVMAFVNGISLLFTENEIASEMGNIMGGHSLLYAVLMLALVPALFEEFVYRGVMFGALRKGGLLRSILLSAFLFALMHLNLNQFSYAFVVGIMMALVVELTGSIFSSMLIHFVVNGSTTVLTYKVMQMGQDLATDVSTKGMSKLTLLAALGFYGVISVIALVGIITLLYVVCLLEKRVDVFQRMNPFCKAVPKEQTPKENLLSIPMIIGILICVVVIVLLLCL